MNKTINTERLQLRAWEEKDLEDFAKMNADSTVMEFYPSIMSREESDVLARKIIDHLNANEWGLWAVSQADQNNFIGYIGLSKLDYIPAIEIGWRLAREYWNQGYATEGASAVLKFGFENLNLDEIISVTSYQNLRSRRVMEKIGMVRDFKADFDHPKLPPGHILRPHVLYRINKS